MNQVNQEYNYLLKKDKVKHYGWTLRDEPGVLMEVDKSELSVDHAYQRSVNNKKANRIASEWSWVACGVLIVASREDGFFVIDGQHRLHAALKRSDIKNLPCIVFDVDKGVRGEAEGFIASNTERKPMTGVDKFRALLIMKDPAAVLVDKMCAASMRKITTGGSGRTLSCVTQAMLNAGKNPKVFERIYPLVDRLCNDKIMHEYILTGMLYIEMKMPEGESLTDKRWADKILSIGHDRIMDHIRTAKSYYKRGGARIYATGIVDAINFKARKKLVLNGSEAD